MTKDELLERAAGLLRGVRITETMRIVDSAEADKWLDVYEMHCAAAASRGTGGEPEGEDRTT